MNLTPSEEESIRNKIRDLKSLLPRDLSHAPREPIHAVLTKTFAGGGFHTKAVDIANDWKRVGRSIRAAIVYGGEVVLRPMAPDERGLEEKVSPLKDRIVALEHLVERVSHLNPRAEEIGAGMLASLVEEATGLMEPRRGKG